MADQTYDFVIIGGGMTADAAAKGIREIDSEGSIVILSDDVDAPYTRPALSKKLWIDPDYTPVDNDLGTVDETHADLHLSTRVERIDRTDRRVVTSTGESLSYGRLLLATGGQPTTLDLPVDERVIYFRTAEDYRHLRSLSGSGKHVAVIGGGYIGSELAAALVQNDTRVTLVFPEEHLGGSVFPESVQAVYEGRYRDHGVTLASGRRLEKGVSASESGSSTEGFLLTLDDGSSLEVDGVVVGLGITPSVGLAEASGLAVDDGIVVDLRLSTDDPFVSAAGDVASYPDPILGRRRVEHVDNAKEQGRVAGRIMAGSDEKYTHTPMYYSKVFDLSYEAVGTLDSSLQTVEDWKDDESAVVYYLDGGIPVGVLLWNIADSTDKARQVLAESRALSADNLVGLI